MSSFLSIIGGAVAIVAVLIVLMYINTIGIKTIFNNFLKILKRDSSSQLRNVGDRLGNIAKSMNSEMRVVQLTTGKCDCCGETFVGTTDDHDCPVQQVSFMGESSVLCNKCLEDLMTKFKKRGKSTKKNFSASAEAFRGLLADSKKQ